MPFVPGLEVNATDPGEAGILGSTTDASAPGVNGVNTAAPITNGGLFPPIGVLGDSRHGVGTWGSGAIQGVHGESMTFGTDTRFATDTGYGVYGRGRVGVYGYGTVAPAGNAAAAVIGVHGQSTWGTGVGVQGDSDSETGVGIEGNSRFGMAVLGSTEFGIGVWGSSRTGVGVRASVDSSDPDRAGLALLTDGDALIRGGLYVAPGFPKSALVKVRDGSHRALYCVESPESWFEDFGRARLVRGRARVRLDQTFAGVVRTGDYHVFLSPEGLSHGLYVSRRTRNGFEVREQHRGTSTVSFSYRIVARRKDVEAPRFKRVKLPNLAKLAKLPKRKPVRAGSGTPSAGGPSRRRGRRR